MGAMADKTPTRRFLTIEQVDLELNVEEPLVGAMLKTGELRGIQVGGRGAWLIGTNGLEEFIAEAYGKTGARITAGELSDAEQGRVKNALPNIFSNEAYGPGGNSNHLAVKAEETRIHSGPERVPHQSVLVPPQWLQTVFQAALIRALPASAIPMERSSISSQPVSLPAAH